MLATLRRQIDRADPALVCKVLATTRVVLGTTAMLAPGLFTRRALRADAPAEAANTLTRMVAGRDLALGVGSLMAAKRGASALRGWTEVGALSDAMDATAMLLDRGLRVPARVLSVTTSAGAAATGFAAARKLTE